LDDFYLALAHLLDIVLLRIVKLSMLKAITIISIVAVIYSKSPPVFNYSYQVGFDETVIRNKQEYHTLGQEFYDPVKNRERVDRANGQHNAFCGTVLPNIATPCNSLTVDGNRWLIFPSRTQCCLCCTSQHGCGILAPDWLKAADYEG
jgi:hypothetical protein